MLFDRSNAEQFALFEKNILYPFLKDTFIENTFGKFTSSNSSGLIWNVNDGKMRGAGETVTFGLYQYSDADEVYDDDSLEGKGQFNRPISQSLRVGETRFAVATEGKKLAEIQTKINIEGQLQDDLYKKSKLLQTRRIINQFGFCFVNEAVRDGNNHKTYSYYIKGNATTSAFTDFFIPKIKAKTIDTDQDSISSDRILFGKDQLGAVTADTIDAKTATEAAIGTLDYTNRDCGALTVDHIERLTRLANVGGRKPNSEQIIMPYKTMQHMGYDNRNLVLFVSPTSASMLRRDPKWHEQVTRAYRETSAQPSTFYNTDYIGSIYNVDIIVIPEFEHMSWVSGAGGNAIKVAYSALCGQSSIVSSQGCKPMFTTVNNDHMKKHELGVTMIDGMKPLKFLAKSTAKRNLNIHTERGIIHSFTRQEV